MRRSAFSVMDFAQSAKVGAFSIVSSCPSQYGRKLRIDIGILEKEIYEFITTLIGFENIIQGDRSVLNGKEIDIFIPKCKISIEYNGLYWHTLETHSDKNYHLNKTNLCNDKGIKLIQIFEDEYVNHKDLVLSKIAHILGKCENLPKIMARKCEIKEISATKSKSFLNKNHIQGNGDGRIHLGAFYNGLLIGVMVFKNECGDKWELTRFATDNSYVCSGVGGKLFKYFTRTYNPTEVKSFADRRWTINEESNVYTNLGFEFNGYTPPDYKYYSPFDGLIRHHKFNFRKTILHKKYNLPLSMTESEMTKSLGYSKIYDCGLIKYIWKKRG